MNTKEHFLQLTNTSLLAKLQLACNLLCKAKQVIKARKQEIELLKAELLQKTIMLNAEMLAHEETNHKLAKALNRLSAQFPQTVISSPTQSVARPTVVQLAEPEIRAE